SRHTRFSRDWSSDVCTSDLSLTPLALATRVNLLVAVVSPVAPGPGARGVVALVNLCVGVAELDGNVPDELVLEADGLHARDGLEIGRASCRVSVLCEVVVTT